MKCLICSREELAKLPFIYEISKYNKKKYPLFRCKFCGLIRPNPLPYNNDGIEIYDSPENIKFYNKKTGRFDEESYEYKYYFKHFKPYLNLIEKYKIKGSAFDIGCGPGHMLILLKNEGFDVEGLDISPIVAKALKDRFKVYCCDLNDKRIKKNRYNLVTLNQVLEHVEKPEKFLADINKMLSKEGYIILAVPYLYGLIPQMLRSKWYGLGYGQHLNFFSKKSLKIILEKKGFELLESKVLSVDYAHPRFPRIINLIADLIMKTIVLLGLGDNLFVVAKKTRDIKIR